MNLNKEKWLKKDAEEFQKYIVSLGNADEKKKAWSSNLLKTKLPVIVIKTPDIKKVVNEISEGNYLSFLDLMLWEYYENTAINGFLICKIKEFSLMKQYLDTYSEKADNWATCDLLSFNIKNNEDKYFEMALEYIKSEYPFKRRIGINILFNFVNDVSYLPKIFKILDGFENEQEYYVNMINAWLLCECYIKHREETIEYLNNNKLNKFTINKAISKCRDSYRVTKEDKEMLLKYKK